MSTCGECKECCIHLPIVEAEIAKPVGSPCKYLCSSGCSIHNQPHQPDVCKGYRCLWRLDKWIGKRPAYRPDRLGVIIDVGQDGDCIRFWETRPGALDQPQVKYIMARLRDWCGIFKIYVYGSILGAMPTPDDAVRPVECADYEENEGDIVFRRKSLPVL